MRRINSILSNEWNSVNLITTYVILCPKRATVDMACVVMYIWGVMRVSPSAIEFTEAAKGRVL
jgi:hypothetical protein